MNQQTEQKSARFRLPGFADVRAFILPLTLTLTLAALWWWSGRPSSDLQIVSPAGNFNAPSPGPSASELTTDRDSAPATGATPFPNSTLPKSASGDRRSEVNSEGLNAAATDVIVVDVRGSVKSRGIQQLPAGSRVTDAIAAAGGLRKGGSFGAVNLAATLTDGQQITVGGKDLVGAGSSLAGLTSGAGESEIGAAQAGPSDPIDLNSANASQLQTIPGVGPVLASRIATQRQEHGPFRSVDGLLDVSGIGSKVLEGMREYVRVP